MFEGLRSLAGLGPMLAALPKMQAAAEEAKRRVEQVRVEGASRDRSVRVVASGAMRVESVLLSGHGGATPEAIREAVNDALSKAQDAAAESMKEVFAASGIPLPPGMLPSP